MEIASTPSIIVHGGAFNVPDSYVKRYNEGTKRAARAGYDCLLQGGTAVAAVEKAVAVLEDDSAFNAGRGSCLTEAGTVEMDAIICDGKTVNTGAVGCVVDIENPVKLARKVMEETPHCLLVGNGALKFARKINFPILSDPLELVTHDSVCKSFVVCEGTFDAHIQTYMNQVIKAQGADDLETAFKDMMKQKVLVQTNGHDTVGAVAIDENGDLASATSTGGMPGKMEGRVGDSPIFGCGAYANHKGACSSTGHGESLIRSTICREAVSYLEDGYTALLAAEKAVGRCLTLTGGRGGIIVIDSKGDIGHAFTTSSMAWASISPSGSRFGMRSGDERPAEF